MRPLSAHSGLRGPPLNLCEIMQRGYLPQVPMLVNLGADLQARDVTGRTPLMLTAYVVPEGWGVGVARLLIEMGVRMDQRDRCGMNALHHSAIYERFQLTRVLLNAPDFNLAQNDRFGNTALHYAAMSGNEAMVRLLAAYHRRFRLPLTAINKQTRTAHDEAFKAGHYQCAAILDEALTFQHPQHRTNDDDDPKTRENSISVPPLALRVETVQKTTSSSAEPGAAASSENVSAAATDTDVARSRANSATVARGGRGGGENNGGSNRSASHSRENSISQGKENNNNNNNNNNSNSPGTKENQGRRSASHSRENSLSLGKENLGGAGRLSRTNSLTPAREHSAPGSRRDSSSGGQHCKNPAEGDPRMFVTELTRLSLRDKDDEGDGDTGGGLFPRCEPGQQDEMVRKLLSPTTSPVTSERSCDMNRASSPDTSPRGVVRRSNGVRRQQSGVATTKLSNGGGGGGGGGLNNRRASSVYSDASSSLSADRSSKPPLLNARRNIKNNANNVMYNSNNNINTIGTTPCGGRQSSNSNGNNNQENETVQIIGDPLGKKPPRPSSSTSSCRRHRRTSSCRGLREKVNNILNDNDSIRVTSDTAPNVTNVTISPSGEKDMTVRSGLSRAPSRILLPYERDPEKEIHVAPVTDFRNSREYVLKLTKMEFNPLLLHTDNLPVLVSPASSVRTYDEHCKPSMTASWRENMGFLYRHLQEQCSPSWRNAAKAPPDPLLLMPPPSTQGDEPEETPGAKEKEKKVRRPSSSQRPVSQMDGVSSSSGAKLKRAAPGKQRKVSNNSPPVALGLNRLGGGEKGQGDPGTEGNAMSSQESLSTGAQGKKKAEPRSEQADNSNAVAPAAARQASKSAAADHHSSKSSTSNGSSSSSSPKANHNSSSSSTTTNHSNNGGSNADATGSAAAAHDRRMRIPAGASESYTVPAVTETLVEEVVDQGVNMEPQDIDNSMLTVLADISEDED